MESKIDLVQGTLILYFLHVRSSYVDNSEELAGDNLEVDTEQWWIGPEKTFKIHTYAMDRDIRIFSMETKEGMEEIAKRVTEENYGKLLRERVIFSFNGNNDPDEIRTAFEQAGLEPTLVVEEGAFMYWRLGEAEYRTKSKPLEGLSPASPKESGGFLKKLFGKR